ncbi:hypothetical protein VTJ04DRAFT_7497 [Mycothermus thermophilus]|uniref:uncharacterized protein n=1 Tax=Humicola insolens TaxID=85995 RepID=UPI0037441D0D
MPPKPVYPARAAGRPKRTENAPRHMYGSCPKCGIGYRIRSWNKVKGGNGQRKYKFVCSRQRGDKGCDYTEIVDFDPADDPLYTAYTGDSGDNNNNGGDHAGEDADDDPDWGTRRQGTDRPRGNQGNPRAPRPSPALTHARPAKIPGSTGRTARPRENRRNPNAARPSRRTLPSNPTEARPAPASADAGNALLPGNSANAPQNFGNAPQPHAPCPNCFAGHLVREPNLYNPSRSRLVCRYGGRNSVTGCGYSLDLGEEQRPAPENNRADDIPFAQPRRRTGPAVRPGRRSVSGLGVPASGNVGPDPVRPSPTTTNAAGQVRGEYPTWRLSESSRGADAAQASPPNWRGQVSDASPSTASDEQRPSPGLQNPGSIIPVSFDPDPARHDGYRTASRPVQTGPTFGPRTYPAFLHGSEGNLGPSHAPRMTTLGGDNWTTLDAGGTDTNVEVEDNEIGEKVKIEVKTDGSNTMATLPQWQRRPSCPTPPPPVATEVQAERIVVDLIDDDDDTWLYLDSQGNNILEMPLVLGRRQVARPALPSFDPIAASSSSAAVIASQPSPHLLAASAAHPEAAAPVGSLSPLPPQGFFPPPSTATRVTSSASSTSAAGIASGPSPVMFSPAHAVPVGPSPRLTPQWASPVAASETRRSASSPSPANPRGAKRIKTENDEDPAIELEDDDKTEQEDGYETNPSDDEPREIRREDDDADKTELENNGYSSEDDEAEATIKPEDDEAETAIKLKDGDETELEDNGYVSDYSQGFASSEESELGRFVDHEAARLRAQAPQPRRVKVEEDGDSNPWSNGSGSGFVKPESDD